MANEFIARNGLIAQESSVVTGSLIVTQGISGSFSGSGANLFNIPATGITGLNLSQISSGSVSASISEQRGLQVNTNVTATSFTGSLFGTASNSTSASYVTGSIFTGTNRALTASFAISSSHVPGATFTSTNSALSASFALTASYVTGSIYTSANPALSASYALSSSLAATASYARYPIITITVTGAATAGALSNTDYVYLVNGTATITLPTSIGNTSTYHIKNIGSGTATIQSGSAGQTIEGSSTVPVTLPVQYSSVTLIASASNWFII